VLTQVRVTALCFCDKPAWQMTWYGTSKACLPSAAAGLLQQHPNMELQGHPAYVLTQVCNTTLVL
jgi:hypothetical protein